MSAARCIHARVKSCQPITEHQPTSRLSHNLPATRAARDASCACHGGGHIASAHLVISAPTSRCERAHAKQVARPTPEPSAPEPPPRRSPGGRHAPAHATDATVVIVSPRIRRRAARCSPHGTRHKHSLRRRRAARAARTSGARFWSPLATTRHREEALERRRHSAAPADPAPTRVHLTLRARHGSTPRRPPPRATRHAHHAAAARRGAPPSRLHIRLPDCHARTHARPVLRSAPPASPRQPAPCLRHPCPPRACGRPHPTPAPAPRALSR